VRIKVGITIAASPTDVWRVIEPIERHVDWMKDAVTITFTSTMHRGVGARFECLTRVGPFHTNDHFTITEWEPGRVMGIEHQGAVKGTGRFTLARRPRGRTRFTWTEALTFPLWMGGPVGALAAKPILRAVWKRNLRRLQHIIELGVA
jgi:hypothetical protein